LTSPSPPRWQATGHDMMSAMAEQWFGRLQAGSWSPHLKKFQRWFTYAHPIEITPLHTYNMLNGCDIPGNTLWGSKVMRELNESLHPIAT
jgi:hypothetical protein